MAPRSVDVDVAHDLLGRALEALRPRPTWSLSSSSGFYLEGSRTPDRDYHRLNFGAAMTGALYITGDEAYLAGIWQMAGLGPTLSKEDFATWGDQWVRMPARRLLRENHDAGLAPQLAKLCDPDSEVSLLNARTERGTSRHLIRPTHSASRSSGRCSPPGRASS